MIQVVTENKSQKEVLFRNRPQRRQVKMIEDGKKIFSHTSSMEFWHIWIWEMHMGEPQALSDNLYRCCSMRTNCSSAKDFEPNLERWLNIIFFCRTVITISILMKIWKRSDIKFRSLQPQFHFKFSLAIQNLGMSSIIKVWQEILLLGCKEMTLWISYSKLFIFKGRGEKNGVMGDRTVGYIQPAGQK